MLVASFRLAAPLSSLGVIVASTGQPNGRTEGRRARGKIFDSARRSRQSTSKTATDASVRIMSLKPSFPPMPVTSQGSMLGRDDLLLFAYLDWSAVLSDVDMSIWRTHESLRVRYSPMTACPAAYRA